MEKIIRRDTLNEVFEVIDKHRSYFENLMSETSLKMRMSEVLLDDPSNMLEFYGRELQDYASALATLELLERELKGEVEY
jgi:hypothetical protein